MRSKFSTENKCEYSKILYTKVLLGYILFDTALPTVMWNHILKENVSDIFQKEMLPTVFPKNDRI